MTEFIKAMVILVVAYFVTIVAVAFVGYFIGMAVSLVMGSFLVLPLIPATHIPTVFAWLFIGATTLLFIEPFRREIYGDKR